MRIRCWGARGSIPVSGPQYAAYGGDTTCLEIRTGGDDVIIVDAGSGIRALGNSLLAQGRFEYAMLFTHGHWDHIMGFPFFKPLYDRRTRIAAYGCPYARASLKDVLSPSMSPPQFPININEITADVAYHEICDGRITLGGVDVRTIRLSHPNNGTGYRFTEAGRSFVFLTDNELSFRHEGGCGYDEYLSFARGADLLVHDAEYTPDELAKKRTWGHSACTEALRLALDAGVKKLGLFHHNQDRGDGEIDGMVRDCREAASRSGTGLEVFGASQGMVIDLS